MNVVRVRAQEVEAVRQQLLCDGALDKSRKLVKKDGFVEIPVNSSLKYGSVWREQEKPEFYRSTRTLRALCDIPEHEKNLLPSGWQILGDVIIVSLHPDLEEYRNEIGRSLLSLYPGCRTVLCDRGILGKMRRPERDVIAGDGITITTHRENGCVFRIDARELMYSKGNLAEKRRMSNLGRGETVVDMFAGIGYFSIPMAVHTKPAKIVAIEINPAAFHWLKENIRINRVGDIVEPIQGDCAAVTPAGIAERVIMGYLNASKYLEHGIRALLPGGFLHYHEAVPEVIEHRPVDRLMAEAERAGRKVEIMETRRIKKYAPGVWHVVVDARID